jgi:hypothetical protein
VLQLRLVEHPCGGEDLARAFAMPAPRLVYSVGILWLAGSFSRAGLRVRIRLPPAASLVRTRHPLAAERWLLAWADCAHAWLLSVQNSEPRDDAALRLECSRNREAPEK